MPDKVMIQVRFSKQTEIGEYNDALYFTQSEYQTTASADIEAAKQARADAWVNAVKNPPPQPVVDPLYTVTNEDGTVTNA